PGNVSKNRLHLHFLKTLEHRTDVSVTSTPYGRNVFPWGIQVDPPRPRVLG
uniref:Uncharacterized protein n=1 Tax=Gopherus agassizii TaxID=38772 RepID=A0A452J4E6_9SAUR